MLTNAVSRILVLQGNWLVPCLFPRLCVGTSQNKLELNHVRGNTDGHLMSTSTWISPWHGNLQLQMGTYEDMTWHKRQDCHPYCQKRKKVTFCGLFRDKHLKRQENDNWIVVPMPLDKIPGWDSETCFLFSDLLIAVTCHSANVTSRVLFLPTICVY